MSIVWHLQVICDEHGVDPVGMYQVFSGLALNSSQRCHVAIVGGAA